MGRLWDPRRGRERDPNDDNGRVTEGTNVQVGVGVRSKSCYPPISLGKLWIKRGVEMR